MYRYFALWILWAAWASLTGWILSALHQLNGVGYTVSALFGGVGAAVYIYKTSIVARPRRSLSLMLAGFFRGCRRRPLQSFFVVLAVTILSGGLQAIPLCTNWNFDVITYRLPRILYWWDHNRWYWTNATDNRMDYSGVGFEWQLLPAYLLTRSERYLFLLNWVPFLFMPAMLLRFLRIFKVSRSAIRILIWVLPSAYCYALQAGSMQSDGYVSLYLMSAFVFLDSYARNDNKFDLITSLLAAALVSGAKLSNVFLLLPYGFMMASILYRNPGAYRMVLLGSAAGVLISFIPLTTLCYIYTGDPSGDPKNLLGAKAVHKLPVLCGNVVMVLNQTLELPVSGPLRSKINRAGAWFGRTSFSAWIARGHPNYSGGFGTSAFAYESSGGLGFGVAVVVAAFVFGGLFCLTRAAPLYPGSFLFLMALASWGAFFIFLTLLAANQSARLAAPYYPLLIATLPGMARGGLRGNYFRLTYGLGCLALIGTMAALFVIPNRPPLPMISILNSLAHHHVPGAKSLEAKYEFWAENADNLQEVRAALPADAGAIGYLGGYGETPYGLWLPFGSRKIFELATPDPRDLERDWGAHFAVVTAEGVDAKFGLTLDQWVKAERVQVVREFKVKFTATSTTAPTEHDWILVTWNAAASP